MDNITTKLIKYPYLQSVISIAILLIYNLILNPNIAFCTDNMFNWVKYTESSTFPFDTWNSVYQADNPRYLDNNAYETYKILNERYLESRKKIKIEVLNELLNTYKNRVYSSDNPLVNIICKYLLNNKDCTMSDIAPLIPSIFKEPELYTLNNKSIEELEIYKAFITKFNETQNPRILQALCMYSAKVYTYNYYLEHNNLSSDQIAGLYTKLLAKILEKYAEIYNIDLHN